MGGCPVSMWQSEVCHHDICSIPPWKHFMSSILCGVKVLASPKFKGPRADALLVFMMVTGSSVLNSELPRNMQGWGYVLSLLGHLLSIFPTPLEHIFEGATYFKLRWFLTNNFWIVTRCDQCSKFQVRVKRAHLADERAQIEKSQAEHIRTVQMFRQSQSRLNSLSELSTSGDGTGASILKVDMDGLDQNKTKYPRNTVNAKSLSNLWRPQCHVVATIVWGDSWPKSSIFLDPALKLWAFVKCFLSKKVAGLFQGNCNNKIGYPCYPCLPLVTQVVELYFVLQPDVAKDSSTEATCLMRALDVASEILSSRGMELPEHLVIEALMGGLGYRLFSQWFQPAACFQNCIHIFNKPCLADRQLLQGGKEPEYGESISICFDHPTVLYLISKPLEKKHHRTISKSVKSLKSIFPSKHSCQLVWIQGSKVSPTFMDKLATHMPQWIKG